MKIIKFCGINMDRFRFVRQGISGLYARARSGRRAVLRKIFLAPYGRSVFSAKILSWANPEPFKLLKQNPSIPAPLRHKRISNTVFRSLPTGWEPLCRGQSISHSTQPDWIEASHKETPESSNLPLGIKTEWRYCYVGTPAYTHAVTWTNIRLFSQPTIQSYVWLYDHLIGHIRMQLSACLFTQSIVHLFIYSVKQPVDISTIRTAIRLFGRPSHRMTGHFMPVSTLCRL